MNAIETRMLTKKYTDVTAVDSLTLTVPEGQLVALLGVNGAGKSTTIKMLSCLTKPTSGDAFIHGLSIIREASEVKSIIAVSPQESAVARGLTVKENLELMCGAHGMNRRNTEQKLQELTQLLGISEVIKKKAGKLSGGWQRRLSIAMALVSSPRVLFLDEPTLGLDVLARSELWDIIHSLKGRVTMVLTTHNMNEAEALSDTVAIMDKGRLCAHGSVDDIKRQTGTDNFEEAFIRTVRGAGL